MTRESLLMASRIMYPVVILAVAGVGIWVGTQSHRLMEDDGFSQAQAEWLYVDPTQLDLGDQWAESKFKWTLTIKNRSPRPINIRNFTTSCRCTTVKPTKLSLSAGATANLELELNLDGGNAIGRGPSADTFTRTFSVYIDPLVENEDRPHIKPKPWILHGRVWQQLHLSIPYVDFGDGSLIYGSVFSEKTIEITLSPRVHRIQLDEGEPAACNCRLHQATHNTYTLAITPKKTLPLGNFKSEILLRCVGLDGEKIPSVILPVSGTVLPDVKADPSLLDFGFVAVGQSFKEEVAFQSRAGIDFVIDRVECDLSGAIVSIGDHDRKIVRISVSPAHKGAQTGHMRAHIRQTRQGREDAYELTIPCQYWIPDVPAS